MLVRCAAAGRLRVDPDLAEQTIMSANVGVALSLVTQPNTALQLAALLRGRPSVLGGPETALLVHWLDTLATQGGSPVGTPPGG
ncbi:hypothetical protein ABT297_36400 [Dactylosporangium sp. NPDC000555]|uniref:hypothetical protein n=1 Tax=Dactylosporangium sp. NPDC000555 TaxID=3154260 RepID=UPI00331D7FFE